MPEMIVCDACGELLFESLKLKSPDEVIQELASTCPTCGKILIFDPDKIDIRIRQSDIKVIVR